MFHRPPVSRAGDSLMLYRLSVAGGGDSSMFHRPSAVRGGDSPMRYRPSGKGTRDSFTLYRPSANGRGANTGTARFHSIEQNTAPPSRRWEHVRLCRVSLLRSRRAAAFCGCRVANTNRSLKTCMALLSSSSHWPGGPADSSRWWSAAEPPVTSHQDSSPGRGVRQFGQSSAAPPGRGASLVV